MQTAFGTILFYSYICYMNKIIVIVISLLMLSSCAVVSTMPVANSATIDQANFKVVRTISREYSAGYFLGLGGLGKPERLKKAFEDMAKELGPNQALAYVNVVESSMIPFIPILIVQTTTISATIVEYY